MKEKHLTLMTREWVWWGLHRLWPGCRRLRRQKETRRRCQNIWDSPRGSAAKLFEPLALCASLMCVAVFSRPGTRTAARHGWMIDSTTESWGWGLSDAPAVPHLFRVPRSFCGWMCKCPRARPLSMSTRAGWEHGCKWCDLLLQHSSAAAASAAESDL